MELFIAAFTLGISLLNFFHNLPIVQNCFTLIIILSVILYFIKSLHKKYIIFILIMLVGFTWGVYRARRILAWHLPVNLIKKTVSVTGRIDSLPKKTDLGVSFNFKTQTFQQQALQTKLHLTWYRHSEPIYVGELWQFKVRLKPAHGLHNPGGFDYQHWLFNHGIRATGYIIKTTFNKCLANNSWRYLIAQLREKIQGKINASIKDSKLAAIITALTIGSRNQMSADEWQIFQATGTSHLIAISGLHIGLIAGVIYFIISFLWRRSATLLLCYPAPQAAAVAAIIAAMIYALLAGLSLPTQRALIMILILMLGQLCYRVTPIWRRLLLAFGIIIIWQPFALSSASFWLSFAAVLSISYSFGGRVGKQNGLLAWLKLQYVVLQGLMPLTLWFFNVYH